MLTIQFYDDHPPLAVPDDSDLTFEDIVVEAARNINITPLGRHLFGLRDPASALWITLSRKVSSQPKHTSLQFRLRFRPPSFNRLKVIDAAAFHYFFHQVRADFLNSELQELIKQPEDGLGLVVTDILLYLLNHPGKKVGDIELKNFFPRELNKMANRLNVKRNSEKLVDSCQKKDAGYVRERYLYKVEESQCGYGREEYVVEQFEGDESTVVRLIVDPFHPDQPGLRSAHFHTRKPTWNHLCRIEDVVFVTVRLRDLMVDVSRRSGTPCSFKLSSLQHLHSFVGCLSGYYRLMSTWTFDLCQELSTPSLTFLHNSRCHGPVGEEFAVKKLNDKGGGEVGVGLLRQCDTYYDRYLLDVITVPDEPPNTFTIFKKNNKFHLERSDSLHDTLLGLLKSLVKSDGEPNLSRILPPSPYDPAQVLLPCAVQDSRDTQEDTAGPRVISLRHLTCAKEYIIRGRFSDLYRAQWTTQGNKEVAVKIPKLNSMETERFLATASDFCLVRCECIMTVHGCCLSPPALVMEYLPLGPLHTYLKKHKQSMKEAELVEAATYLARALWYLNDEGIHHNNIRCHNIFVAEHTDQTFKVKLADPGLVRYDQRDLHWIPREHHNHPAGALTDPTTDTWAFATTLWQIFSYGQYPLEGADMEEVRSLYATGRLLFQPKPCPPSLYKVMLRCWSPDPQARRQPQAVMRDVNQILYQVFNSRQNSRHHAYQTIGQPDDNEEVNGDEGEDVRNDDGQVDDENASVSTQLTTITYSDGSSAQVTLTQLPDMDVDDLICMSIAPTNSTYNMTDSTFSPAPTTPSSPTMPRSTLAEMLLTPYAAHCLTEVTPSPPTQPLQLDKGDVKFGLKIGEGNYGEVYRGIMKDQNGRQETVAIKKFKLVGQTNDFRREIDFMKKLHHVNIVQLLGLVGSEGEDVYMVLEYLPMGSLKDYLQQRCDVIKDSSLLKYALDIAEGMDYLERCSVIHRDLAARNVLVASEHTVKITDFGLAQTYNSTKGNYYIKQTNRALPLPWYALECIEHGKYSHQSDVWSYGVTCWEMFTRGQWPNLPQKPEALIQHLKNGKRLNLVEPCPSGVYIKLIRPCWDIEPQMRPNFSHIITLVKELQDEYM